MQLEKYSKRERNSISDRTLKTRLSTLKKLDEFVDGREPTVEDAEDFVDHLIDRYENGEIKASTIQEYVKHISTYYKTIHRDGDMLDHIDWLPTNDSDPGDYMTESEWEEFMQCVQSFRDKAVIYSTYHYARRPTETLLLNREDVSFEDGTITFSILKKGKSSNTPISTMRVAGWDKSYDVYRTTFKLSEEVEQKLEKYLYYSEDSSDIVIWEKVGENAPILNGERVVEGEKYEVSPLFSVSGRRMSYQTFYSAVKKAAERSSVTKNVTPKTLRHTRSTHLDWGGHSPDGIARQMLLHDPETSVIGRYIHDRDETEVRDVMEVETEQ